jgi:microcystin-dependent protein
MAGYTRQDTANNISNNSIIDADDLDGEFNAIEGAFNGTTGHAHDGTTGDGAPITQVGPGQDIVVGTTSALPKTTATVDLGSSAAKFKNMYLSGAMASATISTTGVATVGGTLGVTGAATLSSTLAVTGATTLTGAATLNGGLNIGADTLAEYISDTVGAMVTGNTESGISVTYDDADNTLDFNVNDPVITLAGVVTGSATMTNLGDVTITTVHTSDPTITLTGDVTGSGTMTNLGNVSIALTVQPNSVALGTDTTGNYVAGATGGTGVTITGTAGEGWSPTIAIGQAVATTSNVTFANLTATGNTILQGNLTVSGTTTTVNTETINLADNIITLNSNEAGTPSQNAGIEVERGTSANKTLVWDEAADKWTVGSEAFVAATVEANLIGNVTGNSAGTHTGAVVGNASTATTLATARNIQLTGVVTGTASFNGSANAVINTVAGSGAFVPPGGIIIWSGSSAAIPSGWLLCDGNNSTPNLRDRFVVGAGSTYAVGATGGAATVTLNTTQIPAHSHTADGDLTAASAGAHTHTGSTNTTGAHTHNIFTDDTGDGADPKFVGNGNVSGPYNTITNGMSSAGDHSHTFTTDSNGAHTHDITGSTANTGGGLAHENLPPYYALCYIMKS